MRKAVIVFFVASALLGTVVLISPRLLRDPEVSNPREDSEPAEDLHLPPEFIVSDPGLLTKGTHEIVEQIRDGGSDAGLEGIPYFITLGDGRYIFGHSDPLGRSRSIYTREPVGHEVYWYGDAIERWQERVIIDSGVAVQPGVAADGAARRR